MSVYILGAMAEELAAIDPSLNPIQMGVGKVNAAIAATRLIERGLQSDDIVLVIGTAAAAWSELEIGDVVIGRTAVSHDVDVTSLGFEPGQVPYDPRRLFDADDVLSARAYVTCHHKLGLRTYRGRVASGDQFIADPADVHRIRKVHKAWCIDMETAAVAQALYKDREKPAARWLAVRIISDLADKSAPVDFPTFLPQAAQTLSNIVSGILSFPRHSV